MPYKFDASLIPNVLADNTFQATGIYIGNDSGLQYGVIDPRRHTINVWVKNSSGLLHQLTHNPLHYMNTARTLGAHLFTNGPQMAPPVGSGTLAQAAFVLIPFDWIPFGRVMSGGRQVHPGTGNNKSFFGRTGEGHFSDYVIRAGLATGVEAIGGLVQIIANRGIVTSPDTLSLGQAIGICAWGLRPIAPTPTDGWQSEIPYIDQGTSNSIDGVLVVACSNQGTFNISLPSAMVLVGVTDAVAMDGSDSVLMGHGTTIDVPCSVIKDGIQRWGFQCGSRQASLTPSPPVPASPATPLPPPYSPPPLIRLWNFLNSLGSILLGILIGWLLFSIFFP